MRAARPPDAPLDLAASRRLRCARLRLLAGLFCAGIGLICLRLLYLQVFQHLFLQHLSQKNFLRVNIIPPLRGNVLDCNGNLLATNRPVFDLYWQGTGLPLNDTDRELLAKIESILASQEPLLSKVTTVQKSGKLVLLGADISFDQVCQLSEQCHQTGQLLLQHRFARIYPHKTLASHILGYMGRHDAKGRQGLEKVFDASLQGQPGRMVHTINSCGKQLAQTLDQEAKAGQDCILNIDLALQELAQNVFPTQESGALILLDPENGAIKAMVSSPAVDPNLFLQPMSNEVWNACSQQQALLNRATCGLYPAASTFKLVTVTAGLEEGMVQQDSEMMCRGFFKFCGRRYSCMNKSGHGMVDMTKALAQSCNIHWWHIAKNLCIDQLALYAHRFGLGEKTGFLLPESAGLVPSRAWKRQTWQEGWWQGETLSVAIGQGYLLATPLQVVRMVAGICSGYLVKPRLALHEPEERTPLLIQPATLAFLRNAMREVVQDGTARVLRRMHRFQVWAKTGTAQTGALLKEKTCRQDYEHAWVAGFFTYQNSKPLAFVVLLEHVGRTTPALATTKRLLEGYQQYQETLLYSKNEHIPTDEVDTPCIPTQPKPPSSTETAL